MRNYHCNVVGVGSATAERWVSDVAVEGGGDDRTVRDEESVVLVIRSYKVGKCKRIFFFIFLLFIYFSVIFSSLSYFHYLLLYFFLSTFQIFLFFSFLYFRKNITKRNFICEKCRRLWSEGRLLLYGIY